MAGEPKKKVVSFFLDDPTLEMLGKQAIEDNRNKSQQIAFLVRSYEEYRKQVIRIPVIGTIRDGGIEFIGSDTELE